MIPHVPFDPWPDVRWDALAIVGGLVFEIPDGWTAHESEAGVRLDREDDGSSVDVRSLSGDPSAETADRIEERPDALVLEASADRILFALPAPDDVRLLDLRIAHDVQVRISLECSAHDWPAIAAVVDGLLLSRWHTPAHRSITGNAGLSTVTGPGPSLPWHTPRGVLDHLVLFRDRGMVPGAACRSAVGVAARELGFVGRFGGLTAKGAELVGPVVDHDALLVVESSDPASDAEPLRWVCWMQGQQCVVRAEQRDGSEALGVVRPGALVAHLLRWLNIDPAASVGAGEPVTVTTAQYEDRSGPCPSDVEWFRQAWAAPRWRMINGWSHQAGKGVHGLLVPGVGTLTWDRDEDTITLRPERLVTLVRSAVEGVNAFVAVSDGVQLRR
ncbi:hypothetical protein [Curtobacterium sp. L1-20]|uniref:hypothetical protein n=1 Tax=Curtobacterium sp. L1-20 TaxID=3138181 RepID=UPI003B52370E